MSKRFVECRDVTLILPDDYTLVHPVLTLHWAGANDLRLLREDGTSFPNGGQIDSRAVPSWPLRFRVEPLSPTPEFVVRLLGEADNVTGEKAVDTIHGRIVNADLDVDANYDDVINGADEPLEETPGGLACVRTNNLTPITLTLAPKPGLPGKLTLSANVDDTRIKVWQDAGRTVPVALPKVWNAGAAAPGTLYVEGITPSAAVRDVELRLEYDENPQGQDNPLFKCEDRVRLTIIKVDLDIWNGGADLDNGEAVGPPGAQVPEGSEVSTGAYVLVNWDDDDGDGAINTATDGWDSNPTPDLNDTTVSGEDNLAKLVPEISPLLTVGTVELEVSGTDKDTVRLWTASNKGTNIALTADKVSWDLSNSSERSELQGYMTSGIWIEGTNACSVERGVTFTLRYKDSGGTEICSDSNKATVVLLRLGCGVHRLGASANEWIAGMGHAGLITAFTGTCVRADLVDPTKYRLTEMQMAPSPGGVKHPTWRQFYDASTNYWGEFDSGPTYVERLKILGAASHLDGMGVTYNLVDLLEHGGLSWDGSLSDLDELRCEGLVEVCHEWNGCNAWGEIHSGSVHYSVVTYCEEHEAAIGSLLNWKKHIFPATQCAEESTYKGADWDTDFTAIDPIEPLSVTW